MAKEPAKGYTTVSKLALLFNLTPRRIQQLVADQVIPAPNADGHYHIFGCTQAYIKYLQESPRGKAVSEKRELNWEIRNAADLMKLKQKARELIPVAEFKQIQGQMIRNVVNELEVIPVRLGAKYPEAEEECRSLLLAARRHLAETKLDIIPTRFTKPIEQEQTQKQPATRRKRKKK